VTATWGEAVRGLRLGVGVADTTLSLALANVGDRTIRVLSYVEAGEVHLDWFSVEVECADGSSRSIGFYDDRDESGIVTEDLAPGETVEHAVDLQDWAARDVNDGEPLPAGDHQLTAAYDVGHDEAAEEGEGSWAGHLEAGPTTLRIAER
jgi:hypothetical protein